MSEMIERVGRAIVEAVCAKGASQPDWDHEAMPRVIMAAGRAAIAAMREPTEAMVAAAHADAPHVGSVYWWDGWRAMIDAALAESTSETSGQ